MKKSKKNYKPQNNTKISVFKTYKDKTICVSCICYYAYFNVFGTYKTQA